MPPSTSLGDRQQTSTSRRFASRFDSSHVTPRRGPGGVLCALTLAACSRSRRKRASRSSKHATFLLPPRAALPSSVRAAPPPRRHIGSTSAAAAQNPARPPPLREPAAQRRMHRARHIAPRVGRPIDFRLVHFSSRNPSSTEHVRWRYPQGAVRQKPKDQGPAHSSWARLRRRRPGRGERCCVAAGIAVAGGRAVHRARVRRRLDGAGLGGALGRSER